MSGVRRSKRKAAAAALGTIHTVTKRESANESDFLFFIRYAKPPEISEAIALLPEHIIIHILGFLDKRELVHRASLVSRAWLNASKLPFLWPSLDADIWRSDLSASKRPIASIARFYQILSRPQFASLKKLVPPDVYWIVNSNVFDRIAALCPHLEEIDLSGCTSQLYYFVLPHTVNLVRFPTLFPNLTKLSLGMRFVTKGSLNRFVEIMGERLLKLHIFFGERRSDCVCSDDALEAVGQHCPNLESFRYGFYRGDYRSDLDSVTDDGVIALLRGCPKLWNLKICGTRQVGTRAFKYIAENARVLSRLRLENCVLMEHSLQLLQDKIGDFLDIRCEYYAIWKSDSDSDI